MQPSSSLAGRTAVVTGASSGIGRAIAEKLGAAGAHVYLAGRTRDAMEASRQRIEAAGGRATVVVLEMRDVGQVRALVDGALRETGRVAQVNTPGVLSEPITDGVREWRPCGNQRPALLTGCQAAVRARGSAGLRGHRQHLLDRAQRADSGVTVHQALRYCIPARWARARGGSSACQRHAGCHRPNFARNFDPPSSAGWCRRRGATEVKRASGPAECRATQPAMQQLLVIRTRSRCMLYAAPADPGQRAEIVCGREAANLYSFTQDLARRAARAAPTERSCRRRALARPRLDHDRARGQGDGLCGASVLFSGSADACAVSRRGFDLARALQATVKTMSLPLMACVAVAVLALGYTFYGKFIARLPLRRAVTRRWPSTTSSTSSAPSRLPARADSAPSPCRPNRGPTWRANSSLATVSPVDRLGWVLSRRTRLSSLIAWCGIVDIDRRIGKKAWRRAWLAMMLFMAGP